MVHFRNNITKSKDGGFMGRFIVCYGENGKPVYQYVYGNTYEEAEKKVQIGMEIEARFHVGNSISVREVYAEWLSAAEYGHNRIRHPDLIIYGAAHRGALRSEMGRCGFRAPCAAYPPDGAAYQCSGRCAENVGDRILAEKPDLAPEHSDPRLSDDVFQAVPRR